MTKDQLQRWDPGIFLLCYVKLYSAVLCSALLYTLPTILHPTILRRGASQFSAVGSCTMIGI